MAIWFLTGDLEASASPNARSSMAMTHKSCSPGTLCPISSQHYWREFLTSNFHCFCNLLRGPVSLWPPHFFSPVCFLGFPSLPRLSMAAEERKWLHDTPAFGQLLRSFYPFSAIFLSLGEGNRDVWLFIAEPLHHCDTAIVTYEAFGFSAVTTSNGKKDSPPHLRLMAVEIFGHKHKCLKAFDRHITSM